MMNRRRFLFNSLGALLFAGPLARLFPTPRARVVGFDPGVVGGDVALVRRNIALRRSLNDRTLDAWHEYVESKKRSVFKEVPIDVATARKHRAAEIRQRREEIMGVREELKRELAKLAELRAEPLPTTAVKIVEVGPDDPDYGDWKKHAPSWHWQMVSQRSPWADFIEPDSPYNIT